MIKNIAWLVDLLAAELKAKGRLAWHQQSCAQLILDCTTLRAPDPDSVWRVKGSHHLSPAAMAVLRAIWRWREEEAVSANKPPFFILPPEAMVNLAAGAVAGLRLLEWIAVNLNCAQSNGWKVSHEFTIIPAYDSRTFPRKEYVKCR